MNIGGGSQLQNIESSRDEQLKGIRSQESDSKKQIRRERDSQVGQTKEQYEAKEFEIMSQVDTLTGQIADMKRAMSELPPNHPQRKNIEKQMKSLIKQKAMLKYQLSSIRARKRSQLQTIRFKANMKEKNMVIRYGRKKSMMLRRFADQVMQAQLRQRQMKQQQSAMGTGHIAPPGSSSAGKAPNFSPEVRGPGGA